MREGMHRVYAVTANLETFCRQRSLKSRQWAVPGAINPKNGMDDFLISPAHAHVVRIGDWTWLAPSL